MTEPFKHEALRQLTCFHDHSKVVAGLTTRLGGMSKQPYQSLNMGLHVNDDQSSVIDNRKKLAEELKIGMNQWVVGEQIHGVDVKCVHSADKGKGAFSLETAVSGVDGFITNEKDILLTAFFADCVPLYFYDPVTEWIGIAHAGWKGTVNGMAGVMLNQLKKKGSNLPDIQMIIGPCISKGAYEVDNHVYEQLPDSYQSRVTTPAGDQHYLLDLKELNRLIAMDKGLPEDNIQVTEVCTYEEADLLYSHRRDQGHTGRMLGYIGLRTSSAQEGR